MKRLLFITSLTFSAIAASAQKTVDANAIKTIEAKYAGGDIILGYNFITDKRLDSVSIKIYRKNAGREILLKQLTKIAPNKKWRFVDTTIRRNPGIYIYKIAAFAGDVFVKEDVITTYAYAPDVRPYATGLKAENKKGTNEVLLSWKIGNSEVLKNLTLLRSRTKEGDYLPVATLQNTDSDFADKVDDANEPFFYKLEMISLLDGAFYNSTSIFVIPEFVVIPSPPVNIKAMQKNKSIAVSWESNDKKARGFYVKKRTDSKGAFVFASTIITANRLNKYEWDDTAGSLKPNAIYEYAIIAESNSFDKSIASDTAIIAYKDNAIKLSPPQDLSIITANDTLYNLAWTIDSLRQKEPAAYVVFIKKLKDREFKMMENGMALASLNYVTIPKPTDGDVYKVQAVNGNEQSDFSIPFTYNNAFENEFGPVNLKAAVIENELIVKWLKYTAVQIKEYRLYKFNGREYQLIETVVGDKSFVITKNYTPGQLNMYQLKAVKRDNSESRGSHVLQMN